MSAGDATGRIAELLAILARLRDPERGCPWDREQDFASIAPYTVEEAYEVAEAIARGDLAALRDELGDLLLQVVFHARMAEEIGAFAFADVVAAICDKMLRRHPHVFGSESVADAESQSRRWEELKAAERAGRRSGLLDQVKAGQPEMTRAVGLQQAAAGIGFDWPDLPAVFDKLGEEVGELRQAIAVGAARDKLADELGDVLFVACNIARHLKIDPGQALRATNAKFERRFRRMEVLAAAEGIELATLPLADQDRLWEQAKAEDHAGRL